MPLGTPRRWIERAWIIVLLLLAIAWWRKGALPAPREIRPELLQNPVQAGTDRQPFAFDYRGHHYSVRPVATYDLYGLVVTHNDIHSIGDMYHDRTAVDTRDFCVLWGDNLGRGDYLRASYSSGSFTCYVKWPQGVHLDLTAIGNNHLITDDPAIRKAIGRVRLGDQIHLRGLLVNYQSDDWGTFWRRTSTRRDDRDCEVVFVQSIDILRRGTAGWYLLYGISRVLAIALPILWLALFVIDAGRGGASIGKLE